MMYLCKWLDKLPVGDPAVNSGFAIKDTAGSTSSMAYRNLTSAYMATIQRRRRKKEKKEIQKGLRNR